jgi:LacI family transcriptional regulator
MSSRPTIADVAKAAGVSTSTVSRVLNGNYAYMRDETRSRVLNAIEELQYRPSSVARSLTLKRTNTAGVMISDVGNPFYPDVIRGIEDVALEHDYNIFSCNTNYDLDRGMKFVRSFVDKRVDGVLIMSSAMSDDWLVELAKNNMPVVVLDWKVSADNVDASTIKVDFECGIGQLVDHFISLGHHRFAHVSGPLHLPTSRLRLDGFLKALELYGIDADAVLVVEGNLRIDGGRDALTQLLAAPDPPTAVFTANDLTAMGLLTAARAHGLRVPEDLSICGLDDIWLTSETDPPLTTVALPRYEIGSTAMHMLLRLLTAYDEEDAASVNYHEVVETRLVVRQSTAQHEERS